MKCPQCGKNDTEWFGWKSDTEHRRHCKKCKHVWIIQEVRV